MFSSPLSQQGGFVGFSSLLPNADQGIGAEYVLVFKAMNKKDSTTKVKAINEFITLLKSNPPSDDVISALLNQWDTFYIRLSDDNDWTVREQAQGAMGCVSQLVKKQLAPHLKTLLPVWLMSIFDVNKNVSNAATEALKVAIPQHKHTDALIFCKQELLQYFAERFSQTAQTLSDPKTPPEVALDKYVRVMSAAILALNYLIEQMPDAENEKSSNVYSEIFSSSFWKFLSNKSEIIRKAAYTIVKGVATRLKPLAASPPLAKDVLGLFSEKDPSAYPMLWDAVLSYIPAFPDAWNHVDVRKHVLPRLYAFLRAATYNSYSVSYPSLLPFLSLIPSSIIGFPFYSEFFTNLWKGLAIDFTPPHSPSHPTLPQSVFPHLASKTKQSVGSSLVSTYFECLGFAWNRCMKETPNQLLEFSDYVLNEGLWEPLQHHFQYQILPYAEDVFLAYATQMAQKILNPTIPPEISSRFWHKIEECCMGMLTSPEAPLFSIRFSGILQSLQNHAIKLQHSSADNLIALQMAHLAAIFIKKLDNTNCWEAVLRVLAPPDQKRISDFQLLLLKNLLEDVVSSDCGVAEKWQNELLDKLALNFLQIGDNNELEEAKICLNLLELLLGKNENGFILIRNASLPDLESGLISWCSLLRSQSEIRPTLVDTQMLTVLSTFLTSTFNNLTKGRLVLADIHTPFVEGVTRILISLFSSSIALSYEKMEDTREDFLKELLTVWSGGVKDVLQYFDESTAKGLLQSTLDVLCSAVLNTAYGPFSPSFFGALAHHVLELWASPPHQQHAVGVLLFKSDWVALTNTINSFLVPNYIESAVSSVVPEDSGPIKQSWKFNKLQAATLEQYCRVCLFTKEVVQFLGLSKAGSDPYLSNAWVAVLYHCACVAAKWVAVSSPLTSWHQFSITFGHFCDEDLLHSIDWRAANTIEMVISESVHFLQQFGCNIYAFALERITRGLSAVNACNEDNALKLFEKFVGPIESKLVESDQALTIYQALFVPLLADAEFTSNRSKLKEITWSALLQRVPLGVGVIEIGCTTRILEAVSIFAASARITIEEASFLEKHAKALISNRDPKNVRLHIALCKILSGIVRVAGLSNWDTQFLLSVRDCCVEWIEFPYTPLRYHAIRLYSYVDSALSTVESLKTHPQLNWVSAQQTIQQIVITQLIEGLQTPKFESFVVSLFERMTYTFKSVPMEIFEPFATKCFPLLCFPHSEVQKWAYRHLSVYSSKALTPQQQQQLDSEKEPKFQLPPAHLTLLSNMTTWSRVLRNHGEVRSFESSGSGDAAEQLHKAFGYVLAWKVFLDQLHSQSVEVRSLICSSALKQDGHISSFLDNLFNCIFRNQPIANEMYAKRLGSFELEGMNMCLLADID